MLGLLLFLFQTIQMLKLCFKLKRKKTQNNTNKNPKPPLPQEEQTKPIKKVKTRLF